MITGHVWRPMNFGTREYDQLDRDARPCQFMNCRRAKADHETAARGKSRWRS